MQNIANLKKKLGFSLFIFTFLLLVLFFNENVWAASASYTPEPPHGKTKGFTNINYEYVVYTRDVGSFWVFDWGDGTNTGWVKVGESDTLISQSHSWKLPGTYNVRVKQKTSYNVESQWSPPLIVVMESDFDGDGYIDEIEFSYNTDFSNRSSFPLDTDGDGVPDENSNDGKYMGDEDDDNDGLVDNVELKLGSNPKDKSDVRTIGINTVDYYLVDITGDGIKDVFYNPLKNINTMVQVTRDGLYLIDFNGDNLWDYVYNPFYGTIAVYEEERFVELPMPLITVAGVVAAIVLIIFILFKTGVIYIYQEYVVEENKDH
ncbi:MAG: hypothetical protein QHH19_07005 [Candidatus Thermoplasmatota archaeon]|nr:hypothetical protein [Candidatus Thermoplasmatota archaeon]